MYFIEAVQEAEWACVHIGAFAHPCTEKHTSPLSLLTTVIQQIIQISCWAKLATSESRSCHLEM